MTRFEPNLRIPGPTGPPAVRPRGRRAADGQPPRRRVQGAARSASTTGMQPVLRHRSDDVILLTCAGHRRPRGGDRQHALPGRPRSSPSRWARSATGSRRSPRSYGADVTRLEVEWGQARRRRRAVRAAAARDPGPQGRAPDPQRDLDRRDERHRALAAAVRDGRARRADPRRRDLGAGRRAVRDGRLGPRPRRHRVAEGVDGRAGHGDGGLGPRAWAAAETRDDAALLPRPQAPPRRRPRPARRRGPPRSR